MRKKIYIKNYPKLNIMYRTSHALAKHSRPFSDYKWMCELDEAKGLHLGTLYNNVTACRTFTNYISEVATQKLSEKVVHVPFFSITSDGAMDSSVKEQEVVFIRDVARGEVEVKFVAVKSPRSRDAKGIFASILNALKTIGITDEVLKKKLVGFGCDGAAVMTGKKEMGGNISEANPAKPPHCSLHSP